MLNVRTMMTADAIVSMFVTADWLGVEFSEDYIASLLDDTSSFDDAVNYLCEVGLLAPTIVERNGRMVAGLRVSR